MQATLNIVGAGKVARALAKQFHVHQVFQVQDVYSRSFSSAATACQFVGAGNPVHDLGELRAADLVMVAVPDDQIRSCSEALRKQHKVAGDTIVFHCSGALSSGELGPITAAASVHPLRSFADPAQVAEQFAGTICTLEGSARATDVLRQALLQIGARVVSIKPENKALYHAGAVFANNYLVTLMDAALQTMQAAGIDADMATAMVQPLALGAFGDTFRLGAGAALTGPIARGDVQTVARHEQALQQWDPEFARLYQALAVATGRLAKG